jgi:hypothetical protein
MTLFGEAALESLRRTMQLTKRRGNRYWQRIPSPVKLAQAKSQPELVVRAERFVE